MIEQKLNTVLLPLLSKYGYVRPSSEMLFVNELFFVFVSYDPRERMTIRFGFHNQKSVPQFIRATDIDIYNQGKLYEVEMEKTSIDPSSFIYACGSDEVGGIRLPNFDKAFSELADSLPAVQQALNKAAHTACCAGWTRLTARLWRRR